MGNREDDLNPNQWIGFELPLRYNSDTTGHADVSYTADGQEYTSAESWQEAGFFRRTQTLRQQASYNLRNLLQTIPGERLALPEYGSRLHHLLFEPMNEELYAKIEDEIQDAVKIWLGYLEIKKIDVYKSKNYDNYINVSIEFSLVGDTAIKKVDLKYEDFDQIADHDKLAG